jgi:hypothetical protein
VPRLSLRSNRALVGSQTFSELGGDRFLAAETPYIAIAYDEISTMASVGDSIPVKYAAIAVLRVDALPYWPLS